MRLPIEVIQSIDGVDRLPSVYSVHILWLGCHPGLTLGSSLYNSEIVVCTLSLETVVPLYLCCTVCLMIYPSAKYMSRMARRKSH